MTTKMKKKPAKKSAAALKAAKVQAEIAKRNKIFAAASAAEKRVLIAKDVLAQIAAKKFKVRSGTWVNLLDNNKLTIPTVAPESIGLPKDFKTIDQKDSIRELFLENTTVKSCECCALGAMFMSCTLYNNKTTVRDFDNETYDFVDSVEDRSFSNGLAGFFSPEQLKLIEVAFECGHGGFDPDEVTKGSHAAEWGDYYKNDKDRLVAIMKNIIKNDGKFVP
jgi:hypothetical protein